MARQRQPSISTHVLDQERGAPARGFSVSLSRWQGGKPAELASGRTDADGRIEDFMAGELRPGSYQLTFHVDDYFRQHGREAPFLKTVVIDFQVLDATRHYHVPLLLSPYSCTTYRGS
jgi:5-hydroxyisourate hydrolase